MKIHKKIQGFTLSEIVVVLILTSVVVGLGFSVLTLVQRHMASIQNNFTNNAELNKLEQSLWLDFNSYSKIEYAPIVDELKFSNSLDSLSYQFQESYIIKENDTFQVQIQNKQFFFDGYENGSENIDAIKIETSKDFQNQKLFIFKENDATLYLN